LFVEPRRFTAPWPGQGARAGEVTADVERAAAGEVDRAAEVMLPVRVRSLAAPSVIVPADP